MNAYKHPLNSNRLTVTNGPHFSIVFALETNTPHTPTKKKQKQKTDREERRERDGREQCSEFIQNTLTKEFTAVSWLIYNQI